MPYTQKQKEQEVVFDGRYRMVLEKGLWRTLKSMVQIKGVMGSDCKVVHEE